MPGIATDPPLFTFDGVRVDGPGVRTLVERLDGSLPDGGVTVVAGPSGSGKSTLLRLCNRLVVPTRGRVLFRGLDVAGIDPRRHRRRVGMVFQRPTPFAGTVADNLRVASPDLDRAGALDALRRADLDESFLDRDSGELSGGEAQRMCLARTLVTRPEVLLMDEPTSALDPRSAKVLEELARGLAASGVPVVWVSHDPAQLRRLADWVVVLMRGRIAHQGPPGDLRGAPGEVAEFLSGPGSDGSPGDGGHG